MKRIFAAVTAILFLCGCKSSGSAMDRGISLRNKLLAQDCSFQAQIDAYYSDALYSATVSCQVYRDGKMEFTVLSPESISDIKGTVDAQKGQLVFDDAVIAFPLLADGQVSPITGPWVMLKALRSGYMNGAGMDGELLQLSLDDSYGENALHVNVWIDQRDNPVNADIYWNERRVLSIKVTEFVFL